MRMEIGWFDCTSVGELNTRMSEWVAPWWRNLHYKEYLWSFGVYVLKRSCLVLQWYQQDQWCHGGSSGHFSAALHHVCVRLLHRLRERMEANARHCRSKSADRRWSRSDGSGETQRLDCLDLNWLYLVSLDLTWLLLYFISLHLTWTVHNQLLDLTIILDLIFLDLISWNLNSLDSVFFSLTSLDFNSLKGALCRFGGQI